VRFNDLDNIGLTGRHFSGFTMMGNHVFNYPDKFVYFTEETVEFHFNFFHEGLGIPKEDITMIEDVWAGGGNLGPCIEFFVGGLEIGNTVFMQFKTFPDGSREELQIKVVDVGHGLERLPWIMNGSSNCYMDVFRNVLEYLQSKLNVENNKEIWEKFGPYSC
jgi:alanyl-tRNA synthetase